MKPSEWAAWAGASTGIASLIWNIYLKVTAGPKLTVDASAGMTGMPPPPGDPEFLKITVRNIGSQPTTLTQLGYYVYNSRYSRYKFRPAKMFVVLAFHGSQFPYKLEVGGEWQVIIEQDSDFNKMLAQNTLWCGVWHSFSRKPAQAKIKATRT